MMETPIPYLQLPARCIIVTQYAWIFVAEVLHKGNQLASRQCDTLGDLAAYVNDWQLRQAGPVFRRLPQSWQFEPLGYEQAAELIRLELNNG